MCVIILRKYTYVCFFLYHILRNTQNYKFCAKCFCAFLHIYVVYFNYRLSKIDKIKYLFVIKC